MPIRLHTLHLGDPVEGDIECELDFVMAFVEVPQLRVFAARQHYRHLQRLDGRHGGTVVRYRSGSFRRELVVDVDGLVVDYPRRSVGGSCRRLWIPRFEQPGQAVLRVTAPLWDLELPDQTASEQAADPVERS